jgi:hypothetical protein
MVAIELVNYEFDLVGAGIGESVIATMVGGAQLYTDQLPQNFITDINIKIFRCCDKCLTF